MTDASEAAAAVLRSREPAGRMLVVSLLLLFYELTLIRYLGTEIPVVGFFKNLILVACYLGFGVGLHLGIALPRAFGLFAATSLLPLLLVRASSSLGLSEIGYSGVTDDEAVLIWNFSAAAGLLVLAAAFACAVVPMLTLGAIVGSYFDGFRQALPAYAWNLVGSLLGTLGFSLIAARSLPPAAWFGASSGLLLTLLVAERRQLRPAWAAIVAALALLPVALAVSREEPSPIWTPYYKLSFFGMGYASGETTGTGLKVNNTWFQDSFNVNYLDREEEIRAWAHAARRLRYVAPFRFARPRHVLVLGSGLGSDSASALHHRARAVRAVDIDPVIVGLSNRIHPNRPYADPRVKVSIDDARHFLSTSDERFDLILLGVLEARSLFSQFSNLRLDNYVYTREGLALAAEHLAPGGVLWLNLWVPRDWVFEKARGLMREVFGERMAVLHGPRSQHYAFVGCRDCSFERLDALIAGVGGIERVVDSPFGELAGDVTLPSDDWPYIFFRSRSLPWPYLVLLAGLVALSLLPLRLAFRDALRIEWGFFFLGAAFLLVEAGAVTRMALLAGTTWVVNSAVFAGVLLFISLANLAVQGLALRRSEPWLFGLAAALLLAFAFPFSRLLGLPNAAAVTAGAALLTLPVFFAGIVFSIYFRDAAQPRSALASNLFGAVLGGFAEYLSMLLGNRAMALVALGLYGLAWLSFRVARR